MVNYVLFGQKSPHLPVEEHLKLKWRKITFFFQNWPKSLRINNYGLCCIQWRSVTHPDICLCWTLTLNIFFWWRHACDVTSCMCTLTRSLTATYDVTVQLSRVTSELTNNDEKWFSDFVSVNDARCWSRNVANMG